jgi:hypothetical protein
VGAPARAISEIVFFIYKPVCGRPYEAGPIFSFQHV